MSFPALALAVQAAHALDRPDELPTYRVREFSAWIDRKGEGVVLATYHAVSFFAIPAGILAEAGQ